MPMVHLMLPALLLLLALHPRVLVLRLWLLAVLIRGVPRMLPTMLPVQLQLLRSRALPCLHLTLWLMPVT